MSDRAPARHRSPERPVTFLADAGEAVSGRLAGVGRSGAVIAASTGILATGGIPTQAYGAGLATSSVTSSAATSSAAISAQVAATATSARAVAASTPARAGAPTGLLASYPASRPAAGAALSAPMTATVAYETAAFRAALAPVPARPAVDDPKTSAAEQIRARVNATRAAHQVTAPKRATPKHALEIAATAKSRKHVAEPAARSPKSLVKKAKPELRKPVLTKPVLKKPVVKKPVVKKPATKAPKPKPVVKSPKAAPSGAVRGSSVLAVAARYVGTPYRYGGTTPNGFDCSGFTQYVYRQLGTSIPRTADQQLKSTRHVTRSQAQAGDLVFFVSGSRAYHVGIYAGGGKIYDSPRTGKTISKRAIWDASVVYGRVAR